MGKINFYNRKNIASKKGKKKSREKNLAKCSNIATTNCGKKRKIIFYKPKNMERKKMDRKKRAKNFFPKSQKYREKKIAERKRVIILYKRKIIANKKQPESNTRNLIFFKRNN